MGTCSGIFYDFYLPYESIKSNGLWVHAGKQIKCFPFFCRENALALFIWLFSVSRRIGSKRMHSLKG